MKDMTLVELYEKGGYKKYPTDKGSDHSYLPEYDKLFKPFQHKKINIFEIGYYKGGSTKLWEDYFTKAKIKVIDINPQDFEESNVVLGNRVIFEQKDVRSLNVEYFKDFIPDIVIDDGSHLLTTQARIIRLMYPIINKGGMIIIEDFNCEKNRRKFYALEIPWKLIDLRSVKGRYDDAFILVKK
jgi:hypothetical protein